MKLFLRSDNNNSAWNDLVPRELFSYSENNLDQVGQILATRDLRRVAWHFLDYGASTAAILQNRLGLSQAATYRYLKDLRSFSFIFLAIRSRLPTHTKGGPRPRIWTVIDASIDQVNDAQKLHWQLSNPKFVAGDRLGQLILEEYMEPRHLDSITGNEVRALAREQGITAELLDITNFAMNYLQQRGMKVWR